MRALLSSVGTRGDVQPIVALAVRVRELGHQVRLCVPPNLVEWVRGFGLEAVPMGVEMRMPAGRAAAPLTAEELRRMRESMPDLITDQFEVVAKAAEGCDVMLGANSHQYAARSIAELRGVPYVTALYAPVAIPSPEHAPPPAPGATWEPGSPETHAQRWADNFRAWNERALERMNHNRARRGLAPIDDVLRYNLTDRPWLATDETLAPLPATPGMQVLETGAWILEDTRPLAPELSSFLEAGAPPIYFGFGSMPASPELGRTLIHAARALGRRAVVSRGWAELALIDQAADCIAVDEVNQQALFPRVAVAVHHGGAGTTAAAARAAVPQLVLPMFGDQFYWGSRVRALGVGASLVGDRGTDAVAAVLRELLEPAVAERARSVAKQLPSSGATVAAQRLLLLADRTANRLGVLVMSAPPGDPGTR